MWPNAVLHRSQRAGDTAVIVEVRQMAGEIHVLVLYHMSTRALANFTRGREAPEGNNQLSAQGTMR